MAPQNDSKTSKKHPKSKSYLDFQVSALDAEGGLTFGSEVYIVDEFPIDVNVVLEGSMKCNDDPDDLDEIGISHPIGSEEFVSI